MQLNTRRLEKAIAEYKLGRVADRILSLVRPSLIASTKRRDEDGIPLGASKIGGQPDLPRRFEWPIWHNHPQTFLGQVNLAEVHGYGLRLPEKGVLSFFLAPNPDATSPQCKGAARVFLFNSVSLRRTPIPADEYRRNFNPCVVKWTLCPSIPDGSHESPYAPLLGLSEEESDAYRDLCSIRDEKLGVPLGHQLGGYPVAVQNDVQLTMQLAASGLKFDDWFAARYQEKDIARVDRILCDAREWRLLMQFDEDDQADMRWIDAGRCYFCYPSAEYAKGDFRQPWTSVDFL